MNEVHIDRFRRLAKLLIDDADNPEGVTFDLSTWGRSKDAGLPVNCKTIVCAIGLACISGAFKDEGLGYRVRSLFDGGGRQITPTFDTEDEMRAVASFFGVTPHIAEWLFSDSSYLRGGLPTTGAEGECAVADRILSFIKGYEFSGNP